MTQLEQLAALDSLTDAQAQAMEEQVALAGNDAIAKLRNRFAVVACVPIVILSPIAWWRAVIVGTAHRGVTAEQASLVAKEMAVAAVGVGAFTLVAICLVVAFVLALMRRP